MRFVHSSLVFCLPFFIIMTQSLTIASIVLAAGFGKRMKSALPKVLHLVAGRPMADWAVATAQCVTSDKPVVVVGHGKEMVEAYFKDRCHFVEQRELLGTGHAVMQAILTLRGSADAVTVTYGDMPLLSAETLQRLVDLYCIESDKGNLAIAMLTVVREDSQGFGRVVRNVNGNVQAIVEEADCTPEQKMIRELNPGVYCFNAEWLWANLSKIPLSKKGEYYLTDMVALAVTQSMRVVTTKAPFDEVNGINTRVHLAQAEVVMRGRILERVMLSGVTIIDPASTYIEAGVEIGQDTVILPGCLLQGKTQIGANCEIGPYSQIVDSCVGDHCRVVNSYLEGARMDKHSEIGPFGRLRTGAHLGEHVHMGNFGEVKNSYLGPGTKMGHFSYIGDTQIEGDVNIGAGTITCNYDGKRKHKTRIGKNVFLGSDTLLVAPLEIGEGSTTGAGSVVTKDVPPNSLVYGVPARQPQSHLQTTVRADTNKD